MKKEEKNEMYARIRKHGNNLLAIFPNATEKDSIALCKKLRTKEITAHRIAQNYCNGDVTTEEWIKISDKIEKKVREILGNPEVSIVINGDPRGYAIKISSRDTRALANSGKYIYRDMGGNGIIAPNLR